MARAGPEPRKGVDGLSHLRGRTLAGEWLLQARVESGRGIDHGFSIADYSDNRQAS